jgi:hypothetical protein
MQLRARAALVSFLTIAVSACVSVAPPPGQPSEAVTHLESNVPRSARAAWDLAQQEAKAWTEGAQLTRAEATWSAPSTDGLRSGASTWAFTFVHPRTQQELLVAVSAGGPERVRVGPGQPAARPVAPSQWRVDSSRALGIFLDQGGRGFLDQHPGSDVRVSLLVLQGGSAPVWLVSGIAPSATAVQTMTLDAATGSVLNMQRVPPLS